MDSGNPPLSSNFTVIVSVLDINEAPSLQITSGTFVKENTNVSVQLEGSLASVQDEDVDDEHTIELIKCSPSPCFFSLDASYRIWNFRPLDYEEQNHHILTFITIDRGGLISSPANLSIMIQDVNEAPNFSTTQHTNAYVDENSPIGSVIGSAILAHDQDLDGGVFYAIASQDIAGCFSIDKVTGQVYVYSSACLDYESLAFDALDLFMRIEDGHSELNVSSVRLLMDTSGSTQAQLSFNYRNSQDFPATELSKETLLSMLQDALALRTSNGDASNSLVIKVSSHHVGIGRGVIFDGIMSIKIPSSKEALYLRYKNSDWVRVFDVSMLQKSIRVIVSVQDWSPEALSKQCLYKVIVNDVNEAPMLLPTEEISVSENSAEGTEVDHAAPLNTIVRDPEESRDLKFILRNQSVEGAFYIQNNSLMVGSTGINYESRPKHTISVQIIDYDLCAFINFDVQIKNENDAPQASCPHYQISETAAPESIISETGVIVSDEDATDLSFVYQLLNATSTFRIDDLGRLHTRVNLDFETQSIHYVEVLAKDSHGATTTCVAVINIIDFDEPPFGSTIYNVTYHQDAKYGDRLIKLLLQDPEQRRMSYSISSATRNSSDALTLLPFDVSNDGFLFINRTGGFSNLELVSYTLILDVSDGMHTIKARCALTGMAVAVTIACPTPPKVMEALENTGDVSLGFLEVIDASTPKQSASIFADFYTLISTDKHVLTSFTVNESSGEFLLRPGQTLDYETQNTYRLQYSATVKTYQTIFCDMSVNVINQNEPPICMDEFTASAEENGPQMEFYLGRVSAIDPEGARVSYFVDSHESTSIFSIGTEGDLYLQNQALLDYEKVSLYRIEVRATDGSNIVSCTPTLKVVDINDCPIFPEAASTGRSERSVPENSAAGTFIGSPIAVTDQDHATGTATPSSRIHYKLIDETGTFTIDQISGQIAVLSVELLDFERASMVVVDVYATDDGIPVCTSNSSVYIHLINVNEAPTILSHLTGNVDEFIPGASPKLSEAIARIIAVDIDSDNLLFEMVPSENSSLFRVDQVSGFIFATDSKIFDYESVQKYTVHVKVTDPLGLSAQEYIDINVNDLNEAPYFILNTASVVENSPGGTVIVNTSATPIAIDPEKQPVHIYLLELNESNSSQPFTVIIEHQSYCIITSMDEVVDYEATPIYDVMLRGCDPSNVCSTSIFTIRILDVNEAPVASASIFHVYENEVAGVFVGEPVVATDPDVGQFLSYSITYGNEDEIFGIIESTGQLLVRRSEVLDYESRNLHLLSIRVEDSGHPAQSTQLNASIIVENVNEVPLFAINQTLRIRTLPLNVSLNNVYVPSTLLEWSETSSVRFYFIVQAIIEEVISGGLRAYCTIDDFQISTNNLRLQNLCPQGPITPQILSLTWNVLLPLPAAFAVRIRSVDKLANAIVVINGILVRPNTSFYGNIHEEFVQKKMHRGVHDIFIYVIASESDSVTIEFRSNDELWRTVTKSSLSIIGNETLSRSIAEDKGPGSLVGDPLVAADQDLDGPKALTYGNLTYSILEQSSPAQFDINSDNGQIFVSAHAHLDYEVKQQYAILTQIFVSAHAHLDYEVKQQYAILTQIQ
ncbi:hypothetical protein ABG067_001248 [Albugo candida]